MEGARARAWRSERRGGRGLAMLLKKKCRARNCATDSLQPFDLGGGWRDFINMGCVTRKTIVGGEGYGSSFLFFFFFWQGGGEV